MWYLLRKYLFLLPAETAHDFAIFALTVASRLRFPLVLLRWLYRPKAESVRAMGLTFPSCVGLAAGLDKNALVYDALLALGFGFVEIGSVTRVAQPGNPKPRLFRLPLDRALLNRMGFNNDGADVVAKRLSRGRSGIVGVNIGKSKIAGESEAAADYVASTERLAPHADYLVINVSSPNTPGLRDLQSVEKLRPLLVAVQETLDRMQLSRPLLVKIAPDLADEDVLAIVDLACELQLAGMVICNTTISREGLANADVAALGPGGVSGAPLKARSLAVLRKVAQHARNRLCLISVGGIETRDDVAQRLAAGATLVQVYSAFVYEGPALLRRLA